MMKLLLRKLPQWQELRQTDIYIDSFDSFTPQEMAVVEKLIALAPSVTVALTLPVGASKTSFLQKQVFTNTIRTADQLKLAIQQAEGTLLEDEVLLGSYRYQAHPDLTYLVKQYHTLLTKPYPQVPAALHLVEAQNLTAEVEYTAREIRRLCREEGYHYSDIAVFMRDLTDYETLLQNTFDDLSIPYFLDMRQSILHHPLLELILAALEIKQERWSYPAVFRYLKSDLAVLTHEEMDELENYVLAFGIKGSYWLDAEPWRFQKRYTLEEEQKALWTEEDLERINAYRRPDRSSRSMLSTADWKTAKTPARWSSICISCWKNWLCRKSSSNGLNAQQKRGIWRRRRSTNRSGARCWTSSISWS